MVLCTTITVVSGTPTVSVTEKGFAVDGLDIQVCSNNNIAGKAIQFAVIFQSSAPALLNVIITRRNPDTSIIVSPYIDVVIPVGSSRKVFTAAPVGSVYTAGQYDITFVELQNIRAG